MKRIGWTPSAVMALAALAACQSPPAPDAPGPGPGTVAGAPPAGATGLDAAWRRAHPPAPEPPRRLAARRLLAAPPANDDFAAAKPITALPFTDTLDVSGATTQPNEQACTLSPGMSAWYTYTAPADMRLVVSAARSNFLAEIAVYTGTFEALTTKACDGGSRSPQVLVDLQAGETIFIRGAGVAFDPASTPTLVLDAKLPDPAPVHDDFDAAKAIGPLPYEDRVAEFFAVTAAADDPADCNGSQDPSVWYRYTNTGTTPFRLALDAFGGAFTFSGHLFNVDVYTGARGALAKLMCNTPFYPARGFVLEVPPGATIYAALTGIFGDAGPSGIKAAAAPPGPANDDFDAALAVDLDGAFRAADVEFAALSLDDPVATCSGARNSHTAWWRFVPMRDGEVEFVGRRTTFGLAPVQLSVYTGARGTLTELGCYFSAFEANRPSAVRLPVQAGVTYHVLGATVGGPDPIEVGVRTYVPLQAQITVDPVATLDRRTNRVTVSGTIKTNKFASVAGCGALEQKAGRLTFTSEQLCLDEPAVDGTVTWRQTLGSSNGILTAGNATVRLSLDVRGVGDETQQLQVVAPVRLKAAR